MSATPTRLDWNATGNLAPTVAEGNRLLDSIGRQETLRSLLAFSDLHENIRLRRLADSSKDEDLFQTERFVFHEVLRLICERAQSLTGADAVLIALFEGQELVCRAAAGPTPVPQGIRLDARSSFLNAALNSGQILRCDDANSDVRVEYDFARQFGANSTAVVPLRGRAQRLGVLQALSARPWAFTDQDIRSFDLLSELVLAALKPEDQDRRFHWLTNVAGEILQNATTPTVPVEPTPAKQAAVEPTAIASTVAPIADTAIATAPVIPSHAAPIDHMVAAATPEPAQIEASNLETKEPNEAAAQMLSEIAATLSATTLTTSAPALPVQSMSAASADLNGLTQPVVIHAPIVELPEDDSIEAAKEADAFQSATESLVDEQLHAEHQLSETPVPAISAELESSTSVPSAEIETLETEDHDEDSSIQRVLPFSVAPTSARKRRQVLRRKTATATPLTAHPGLAAVVGLVAVAALFSAGVWWGMQYHAKPTPARIAAAPQSVTSPAAPDVTSPASSDNLMTAAGARQDSASTSEEPSPAPVSDAKLAALPKITGVRHWSSSMGSTVVIDMEDQVNYEVHRLMSPERIYFDLHDTALPSSLDGKTMDVGDTALSRVRVAQPVAGITRIVLDTKGGSNFSVSMESNPYRLVVELHDAPKMVASKKAAPATATSASLSRDANSLPIPARTAKFRIVLDAGHGGWDLGTVGREGLMEKDLVLDVTKRLGKLLEARRGADVLFTRSGDDYIALDQRADFANQSQADLFVSVHANYSNKETARGVETYYTNVFAAPGSKEIEKHADGTFTQPTPISLSPGALHEKIEESRRLAASVQRSLYSTLAAKSADIRDRGIKDASFVVLTGTTMPAILTEISFVSSPADEHSLQSETYRQQIAEAIFKGISQYEDASPRTKVAQLHPSATGR
jgi:N-acetylmuramoyl-L-alanine amidase